MFDWVKAGRLAGLTVAAALAVTGASAQEDFYAGKTIRMLVGFAPGGGYDAYSRLAAEFLGRHIPGNPEVIVENMPGGGGRVAAMNLYSVAPKDGTTIGVIVQSIALDALMGQMPADVDPTAYNYLGRLTTAIDMQYMLNSDHPVKNLEDATEIPVVVASTGPSSASSMVPRLLNDIEGTQFQVVEGYGGTAEAALAMEQGEVDAIMQSIDILELSYADQLASGDITLLWQLALEPHPNYPDVPAIGQLGETEEDQALLRLIAGTSEIGRSFVAPPGVPEEQVETLRAAFAALADDPEFAAAAEARQLSLMPLPGADLQALVAESAQTPEPVIERLRALVTPQ